MAAIDLLQDIQTVEQELAVELSTIIQQKVDSLAEQTGLDIGEIAIHLQRAPGSNDVHYAVSGVTIEHSLPGRMAYYG